MPQLALTLVPACVLKKIKNGDMEILIFPETWAAIVAIVCLGCITYLFIMKD